MKNRPSMFDLPEPDPLPIQEGTDEFAPGASMLLRNYLDAMKRHPGRLVLYRVGDFYEVFGMAAFTVAICLEAKVDVLPGCASDVSKYCGVPLFAIPCGQFDEALGRLTRAGHEVAINCPIDPDIFTSQRAERVVAPIA